MRVKICGVRTIDDARMCASLGADAVGMLLAKSPRRISVSEASEIARRLPPFVTPVIVMMPESSDEVLDAASQIHPGVVQLQGNEPPELLIKVKNALPGLRLVKAIHVGAGGEMDKVKMYEGIADALLLDTVSPNSGGSGKTHDWTLSRSIVSSTATPVILAGGLKPSNVASAITAVRPFAVDVASGVENGYRMKDKVLVGDFIRNAKKAMDGSELS